jgi:hypothetical protein
MPEIFCDSCNTTLTGKDYSDVGFQFLMHTCDLDNEKEDNE